MGMLVRYKFIISDFIQCFAALYLFECDAIGSVGGEAQGRVFVTDKAVNADLFVSVSCMVCVTCIYSLIVGHAWCTGSSWLRIRGCEEVPSDALLPEGCCLSEP